MIMLMCLMMIFEKYALSLSRVYIGPCTRYMLQSDTQKTSFEIGIKLVIRNQQQPQ